MENRFDESAKTWDEKPDRVVMAEKFAEAIKQIIKGKNFKTALEYGCGTGNVSFFLKDYFNKIVLADASQGMIEEVQKKIAQESIEHFTSRLLDLEKKALNEKFDVIYTLMTMHHVKDIEKVIKEFSKMLLPGGVIIIGDLVKEDGNFHRDTENHDVLFGFEKEYLEQVLGSNKFKINSYNIFHEIERTHTGTLKTYPLFIVSSSSQ